MTTEEKIDQLNEKVDRLLKLLSGGKKGEAKAPRVDYEQAILIDQHRRKKRNETTIARG